MVLINVTEANQYTFMLSWSPSPLGAKLLIDIVYILYVRNSTDTTWVLLHSGLMLARNSYPVCVCCRDLSLMRKKYNFTESNQGQFVRITEQTTSYNSTYTVAQLPFSKGIVNSV